MVMCQYPRHQSLSLSEDRRDACLHHNQYLIPFYSSHISWISFLPQASPYALVKIFSGDAKGEGCFVILKSKFRYILEPQFVNIIIKVDGKNSSFSVRDKIDVEGESFRNPVTGEEQKTEIHLPKGFIWKLGQAAKSKFMRVSIPHFNFDDSGQMQ